MKKTLASVLLFVLVLLPLRADAGPQCDALLETPGVKASKRVKMWEDCEEQVRAEEQARRERAKRGYAKAMKRYNEQVQEYDRRRELCLFEMRTDAPELQAAGAEECRTLQPPTPPTPPPP